MPSSFTVCRHNSESHRIPRASPWRARCACNVRGVLHGCVPGARTVARAVARSRVGRVASAAGAHARIVAHRLGGAVKGRVIARALELSFLPPRGVRVRDASVTRAGPTQQFCAPPVRARARSPIPWRGAVTPPHGRSRGSAPMRRPNGRRLLATMLPRAAFPHTRNASGSLSLPWNCLAASRTNFYGCGHMSWRPYGQPLRHVPFGASPPV